jgi:Protein of unknown function (DUF3326)
MRQTVLADISAPYFVAAMIIPTGVGAAQGGYGGDAMVWLNLLASQCDVMVTHPNVANAAAFQRLPENALYVEGHGLDQWFAGRWALQPVRRQRVGVLVDGGMEPGMAVLSRNTIAAVGQVYGVDIAAVATTSEPLALKLATGAEGESTGQLLNPQVLIHGARALQEQGATAIALATRMVEPQDSEYAQGVGVDPIGGLEALLSHTVVEALGIPCANAPVFDWAAAAPRRDQILSPKTAAEYITATFLPCVLTGLARAPHFVPVAHATGRNDWRVDDLSVLVVPQGVLQGPGPQACVERGIPVIVVTGNTTVLPFSAEAVWGQTKVAELITQKRLFFVSNYLEAAGLMAMLRLGLSAMPV